MHFKEHPSTCMISDVIFKNGQFYGTQTGVKNVWKKSFQPRIGIDTKFVSLVDNAK